VIHEPQLSYSSSQFQHELSDFANQTTSSAFVEPLLVHAPDNFNPSDLDTYLGSETWPEELNIEPSDSWLLDDVNLLPQNDFPINSPFTTAPFDPSLPSLSMPSTTFVSPLYQSQADTPQQSGSQPSGSPDSNLSHDFSHSPNAMILPSDTPNTTSPHFQSTTTSKSPSKSPTSTTSSTSKVHKRTLNTLAARRYRQKKVDQVSTLESALKETEAERDELKIRVARLEGEVQVLRGLMGSKS